MERLKKSGSRLLFLAALLASATASADEGFDQLVARCASDVHPATIRAVVAHESGFDPLVIGVNGPSPRVIRPSTLDAAVETASRLIAGGQSIDVGLGQINSKNFRLLGLTVKAAFDPCQNLAAAARLLRDSYARLLSAGRGPRSALDAAISEYNTGNPVAGISNGYVAAVHDASLPIYAVPDISDPVGAAVSAGSVALSTPPPPPRGMGCIRRRDKFVRGRHDCSPARHFFTEPRGSKGRVSSAVRNSRRSFCHTRATALDPLRETSKGGLTRYARTHRTRPLWTNPNHSNPL